VQTPFDCHKFSRKFINDDENESKNIILFADKRPRERANKKNKNLQKSAIKKPTNLTNNTNPLKLSTPLPMQGGLGVGLLVTPSLHPLHPPKQGARPVFIGVLTPLHP
jgi:hypothetical protein